MKTSISRRAIVAGIAAMPIAGPPAVAESDPIFAALEKHSECRRLLDAAYHRSALAADALEAATSSLGVVTYQGVEVKSREHLEALRGSRAGLLDDELEESIARLRGENAKLRARAAAIGLDLEYQTARAAIEKREEALRAVQAKCCVREAERATDEPFMAAIEAEAEIIASRPTTKAGALALLAFIADRLKSDDLVDDTRELVPDAIRNAAALLEIGAAV